MYVLVIFLIPDPALAVLFEPKYYVPVIPPMMSKLFLSTVNILAVLLVGHPGQLEPPKVPLIWYVDTVMLLAKNILLGISPFPRPVPL